MGTQLWLYPLTVMFIGARQHGLLVLAHDAAHYRLCKNRALNDWLGEILLAWPFIVLSMRAYRSNHFPHHRHLNTDRDPDWVRKQTEEWRFPKTKLGLAWLLLSYASGLGFLRFLATAIRLRKPASRTRTAEDVRFARGRLAFLCALFAGLFWLEAFVPFLLLWLVPYATWMQLCFHIRSIAEHFAIYGRHGVYAETRTVATPWLERLFLVPNHVGYHLEHHLYPSVPFHRLPELHRRLMSNPDHARSALIARSYTEVLRDCVRRTGQQSAG
jgi:fatty acid desaturase